MEFKERSLVDRSEERICRHTSILYPCDRIERFLFWSLPRPLASTSGPCLPPIRARKSLAYAATRTMIHQLPSSWPAPNVNEHGTTVCRPAFPNAAAYITDQIPRSMSHPTSVGTGNPAEVIPRQSRETRCGPCGLAMQTMHKEGSN